MTVNALRTWVFIARISLAIVVASAAMVQLFMFLVLGEVSGPALECLAATEPCGAADVSLAIVDGAPLFRTLAGMALIVSSTMLIILIPGAWKVGAAGLWLRRSRLVSQWFLTLVFLYAFANVNFDLQGPLADFAYIVGWPLTLLALIPYVTFRLVSIRLDDNGALRKI